MEQKKTAIVLGGVQNHIHLINRLKERGFYTILVDYLENPRAKEAADEHVRMSTFDFDAVKALAVERKADLIINACLEHLNAGICRIAEELGLPHPYSYETALDISHKERMKAKMVANGISTKPYVCVSAPEDVKELNLKFPVYVKSCEGSGSNAVNRATTIEEVRTFVAATLDRYPGKRVMIEEEAKGTEYNVYCYPNQGKANVLMIAGRYTDNLSEDRVTKMVATWAPALISEQAKANIHVTAQKITEAFGLENVPMFMQVMVNGDEVNVIEFAGRMSGGFGYRTIYRSTGLEEFDATINSFLRLPNQIEFRSDYDYITVSMGYARPCTFDHMEGCEALLADGTITDVMLPRLPGAEITEGSANGSCVVFFIHKDPTIDGLLAKIKRTFETVECIGTDGKPHLNKELYLKKHMLYPEA